MKKGIILLVTLLSSLSLSGCSLFKNKEFDSNKLYKLKLINNEVVCTNYDFVVCLNKEKGKDFKVLNFADIQLTKEESKTGNETYEMFKLVVDDAIKKTNPDLITLSGDQGHGEIEQINAIGTVLDSYNIPWAPTFGNHDNECIGLSLKEQVKEYAKFNNCIMKLGPANIGTNYEGESLYGSYIVNIVEIEDNDFSVFRSIYILNTGNTQYYQPTGQLINYSYYQRNTEEQISFYSWGVKSANQYGNGNVVKSSIVQHIPLTAYAKAFVEAFNTDCTMYQFYSLKNDGKAVSIEDSYKSTCWRKGYEDSFGIMHDGICCPPILDDVFERLKENNSLDSIIAGHDHANNFVIKYQDVYLAYGTKTGIGDYHISELNGSTIMNISNDNNISFEHIYYK